MAEADTEAEDRPIGRRAARGLRIAAYGLIMLLAIAAAAWLAVSGEGVDSQPPLILAETSPERAAPDPSKPNGAVIPHQGEIVYEVVNGDARQPDTEAMAPASEAPLPAPSTATAEIAADPAPSEGPVQLLPPEPKPDRIGAVATTASDKLAAVVDSLPEARQVEQRPRPATFPPANDAPAPPKMTETPSQPDAAMVKPAPTQAAEPPEQKPAPAPPPPKAAAPALANAPPERAFRIQLGAVRDKATAQREWRRLRGKHKDILGGLQLYLQQVDIAGKGEFHRIQAGPLSERLVAEIACDQLKARKAPCFVVAK